MGPTRRSWSRRPTVRWSVTRWRASRGSGWLWRVRPSGYGGSGRVAACVRSSGRPAGPFGSCRLAPGRALLPPDVPEPHQPPLVLVPQGARDQPECIAHAHLGDDVELRVLVV